jgi:putative ABC transport system permease protein
VRNWEEYARRRLSLPALPPERESRIARELGAQLEDFYREALSRGASEAEAEADAIAQVQDWDRLSRDLSLAEGRNARPRLDRWSETSEERARAGRGGPMLADVLSDTRFAVRELVKNPGFTLVALFTLAIGIGATSAVFSVIQAVLLRPLPYAEPERLVRLYETVPQFGRFSVAPANFLDWDRESKVFEGLAAFSRGSGTLTGGDAAERVSTVEVSHRIFQVLGVSPALGREFRPEEDAPGKNAVLVLSHGAWQRRHGGDPSILGRTLTLDGLPVTVVGVMPQDFYFPTRDTEYWTPLALETANAPRGAHYLGVIGRLAPGTSISVASAEMRTIADRLAAEFPQNADESVEVQALHEGIVGSVRASLLTILAAVGLLTLIACGNVANLLLGRASARGKEIAVRAALGASRSRLARQMMVEGAVLGLAAGALGLAIAYGAIDPIRRLSAGGIPRADEISIDGGVLAFTFLVSILTGMLFSLVPAWQGSRARPIEALREGGRTSGGVPAARTRNALITAEVALSVVLLVGASLLLRSFSRLSSVDPGFRPENVLTFSVSLPSHAYPESHERIQFFDALLERLRSLPRVRSAGMVQALPLRDDYFLSIAIEGRPEPPPGEEPSVNYRVVSPGYFETMGIPLERGRAIDERDRADAPFVAVVDDELVKRHFPAEDPIGRRIDIGNGLDDVYEIVGVVGDVRHDSLDLSPHPTIYVPFRQDAFSTMSLLVRADVDPRLLAPDAREAVRELDRNLPPYSEGALESVLADSLAERRFSMLLLVLFAGIASFLAAVGLYGVVSYAVSRRTREVGLRVAMGAPPTSLIREILGEGMKPALAGVVLGLVSALALSRALESFLYGVTAFDPASYAATALGLLVVAVIACLVPAWKASRMDPLEALRHE